MRNLWFENSWPYQETKNSTANLGHSSNFKKVPSFGKPNIPLGVNIFSPNAPPQKAKPIISHHFVPNTFRDEKMDKLSIIYSMGDQEGFDSPLNPKSRSKNRNGSFAGENQTPLSRFGIQNTPSNNTKRMEQDSMTPTKPKTKHKGSVNIRPEEMVSQSNQKLKKNERKKTNPVN